MLFFGVPNHFMALLLFKEMLLHLRFFHVFCGGANFGFLLFMRSYIPVVARNLAHWLGFHL